MTFFRPAKIDSKHVAAATLCVLYKSACFKKLLDASTALAVLR
jgi:hypothetical protein